MPSKRATGIFWLAVSEGACRTIAAGDVPISVKVLAQRLIDGITHQDLARNTALRKARRKARPCR